MSIYLFLLSFVYIYIHFFLNYYNIYYVYYFFLKLTDKGVELFRSAIMNRTPPLVVHFSGNHLSSDVLNQVDNWINKLDIYRSLNNNNNNNNFYPTPKLGQQTNQTPQQNNINNNEDMNVSLLLDDNDDEFYDNDLLSHAIKG